MSEQDHRRVKQRIVPMLGFKRFDRVRITISRIELAVKIEEGSVQAWKTGEQTGCRSGNLGGCSRPLSNEGRLRATAAGAAERAQARDINLPLCKVRATNRMPARYKLRQQHCLHCLRPNVFLLGGVEF